MKKRDFIVIGIVLAIALVIGLISLLSEKPAETLSIYVAGELYGEYSLNKNQEIAIGDTNVCMIEDGKVRMMQATCPDQICVEHAAIARDGATIVCLPNRVVLEICNESEDGEPMIDGIS